MEPSLFKNIFQMNSLISFGALLLAGLVGGQLAHHTRFLPKITGYIVIGFILGPHGMMVLNETVLESAKVFSDLAVGLILFQLGLRINLKELHKKRYFLKMGCFESVLSFALIFLSLSFLMDAKYAALVAAIGVSVSPAITLLISEEFDANGPVVGSSLILTAMNNIFSFLLYILSMMVIEFFDFHLGKSHFHRLLFPIHYFIWPFLLAYVCSQFMILIGRYIGKKENSQFALLIGMLVLSIGASQSFHISPLLTCLVFGIFVINLDKNQYLMEVEFGHSGEIFFIILFVIAGTHLELKSLFLVGPATLVFILIRYLSKLVPVLLTNAKSFLTLKQKIAISITLLPLAGTAISLLNLTRELNNGFYSNVSAIILSAIAILETLCPILTLSALKITGELKNDTSIKNH